tara:strand:+ start:46 stop:438 length:393 start_codon:yes stop_codon:yes gene_type:complete
MKIKEIEMKDLTLMCVELISRTFIELGQSKQDETQIVILAQSLANDLKEDFGDSMSFSDIVHSFREGVRNTENVRFVINVQTYYMWIKTHRQLIWNESSKEPERQDKRLKYRSRKGTGLNSISNIKQLKQ